MVYNIKPSMFNPHICWICTRKFVNNLYFKDHNDIVSKIESIIENPNKFKEIDLLSRKFAERHQNHIKIANQFLDIWKNWLIKIFYF